MKLSTYQAYTMAEALAAVKRDLGDDAVILNTRTYRRGGFFGLGRRTIVEVTASLPANSEPTPRKTRPSTGSNRSELVTRIAARNAYRDRTTTATTPDDESIDALSGARRAERLMQALAEQHERRQHVRTTAETPAPTHEPVAAANNTSRTNTVTEPKPAPPTPPAEIADPGPPRRFILTSPHTDASPQPTVETVRAQPVMHAVAVPPVSSVMQDELAAIRTMVGQVLQCQAAGGRTPEPMPEPLFEHYLRLISQDVSEELADRIARAVRAELGEEELLDPITVGAAVRRHLASYIPVAPEPVPLRSPDDRPLTIALVGPTGVGKTTTLAKLAATFKLKHNRSVGLVTSDTYRIAAVDQLRTYANIIGLPLQVALTPADMRQAIHALDGLDVILIDTAGRSQHDTKRIDELRRFIDAASPHETHLVLSSTASEKVLLRESEAFSTVGIDKIVLTKLDEAVSFGMLVTVIRRIGKDLSFVTTGQEVPDHIEAGRSERLADLVLGAEVQI